MFKIILSIIFIINIFPTKLQAQESLGKLGLNILNKQKLNPKFYSYNWNNYDNYSSIKIAQSFPANGAPRGRRKGGTSRNGCGDYQIQITALVPGETNQDTSFLSSTISLYPTFWVYVPELKDLSRKGEFILQDEQGKDIWRSLFSLTRKAGFIGIQLPKKSEYALQTDKKYHWYFRVYCNYNEDKSDYIFVDAWLKKETISLPLRLQLQKAKSQEYKIYMANQLWYEAFTDLAKQCCNSSGDVIFTKEWTKLLTKLGLQEFTAAPIVQVL
jgi:Domain of Unknown Function (DUF928)